MIEESIDEMEIDNPFLSSDIITQVVDDIDMDMFDEEFDDEFIEYTIDNSDTDEEND